MRGRGFIRRVSGRAAEDRQVQMRTRLDKLAERNRTTQQLVRATAKEAEFHVREVNRISPQLAALESKVETLRQLLEAAPRVADGAEVEQGRALLEQIQREHAQIRVRLSAVTTYEERLRRIEEQLGLPHD